MIGECHQNMRWRPGGSGSRRGRCTFEEAVEWTCGGILGGDCIRVRFASRQALFSGSVFDQATHQRNERQIAHNRGVVENDVLEVSPPKS
jgi:hypothetical protein